jgi:hypothetical protein
VTGPDSQLLLPGTALAIGELINGGEGNGTLTIANGGLVSAQTVTLGEFDAGTTGVLNLDGTSSARGVLVTPAWQRISAAALSTSMAASCARAPPAQILFPDSVPAAWWSMQAACTSTQTDSTSRSWTD